MTSRNFTYSKSLPARISCPLVAKLSIDNTSHSKLLRRLAVTILAALVIPPVTESLANGMTYDNSVVRRTGNLVPQKTREITLEKENVDITLR